MGKHERDFGGREPDCNCELCRKIRGLHRALDRDIEINLRIGTSIAPLQTVKVAGPYILACMLQADKSIEESLGEALALIMMTNKMLLRLTTAQLDSLGCGNTEVALDLADTYFLGVTQELRAQRSGGKSQSSHTGTAP